MKREKAVEELYLRLSNEKLRLHSLAVEAIMKEVARHFSEDEYKWSLAGLLHDIDYEKTMDMPSLHGIEGAKVLEDLGIDEEIVYAVKAHNDVTNLPRQRKIDKALYCVDALSGLLVACAYVIPSKNIKDVKVSSVLKKMKNKSFAEGADREKIKKCSELDISLENFIRISLDGLGKSGMFNFSKVSE